MKIDITELQKKISLLLGEIERKYGRYLEIDGDLYHHVKLGSEFEINSNAVLDIGDLDHDLEYIERDLLGERIELSYFIEFLRCIAVARIDQFSSE
jgi:hypothetical protein